jgi:hypothetical protein
LSPSWWAGTDHKDLSVTTPTRKRLSGRRLIGGHFDNGARNMASASSQCGSSADLIIMGKNAADAFESNANVLNAYDKMRIAPGELTAKNLSWGVQSLGTYRGVPLYVNESEYQDSDNSMKPFVPVDNVLIASSASAGSFAYAGVPQVDQDERSIRVYEGARVPLISYENFEDIRKFRLSSRPVPVPQNLSAWTILDVL